MPIQPARWMAGHSNVLGAHRLVDVRDAKTGTQEDRADRLNLLFKKSFCALTCRFFGLDRFTHAVDLCFHLGDVFMQRFDRKLFQVFKNRFFLFVVPDRQMTFRPPRFTVG